LIIDPVQIFGSFSGSTSDNWGYTATFDNSGHLYGGGIVFGTGYPTVTGSYDATFNAGQIDMGISKFSADGSDLLWSTYLGGSGNDIPHSMIVNNAGELLIYGTSGSSDFPMAGSPFDNTFNGGPSVSINSGFILFGTGVDIVLAKLSSDGSSLESSTYLGGSETDGFNIAGATEYNYGDHARGEIVVDALDNIYVASSSQSDNFPVTAGCFDNSYNGGQDAVIFAMNNDMSSLLW
ncbi:MAG TPA: PKD domain-containing protein, partial [Bacteroidetes bacterium]|nr:PKD domain-containing protein [Bacteroidota bacterium]